MSKSLVVPTNIFSVPEIGLFILSLRGHEVDIYNLIKKISIPDLYISICKDFPVPYLHNGYYMIAELYSHSGSHLVSPEKTAIIHCQESLTSIRGVFTNKKLSDIDKDGYFSNVVSFVEEIYTRYNFLSLDPDFENEEIRWTYFDFLKNINNNNNEMYDFFEPQRTYEVYV